ncbi:MAG: TIM barrel protein, partial [Clostridia bacterium]|nr:TIM barrel protein [Clostridia bacterium]
MKIVFSTKNVSRATFLDTCRFAYDYGFEGFEIYDAVKERSLHHDSILRRDRIADAKRKLVNRNLAVSALRMPYPIESSETSAELVEKYIDMASASGVESVIVRVEKDLSFDLLDEKMGVAIKRAQAADINVLFETVGYLANTEKVIDIINHFASAAVGASWNVRGTYFCAHESAETTIKNLGAYIKYVRLGDMKDQKTVLIGEGDLEVEKVLNALSSLNYDGFICAAW